MKKVAKLIKVKRITFNSIIVGLYILSLALLFSIYILSLILLNGCMAKEIQAPEETGPAIYEGARLQFLAQSEERGKTEMIYADSETGVLYIYRIEGPSGSTFSSILVDSDGKPLLRDSLSEWPVVEGSKSEFFIYAGARMEFVAQSEERGKTEMIYADSQTGVLYIFRIEGSSGSTLSSVMYGSDGKPLLKETLTNLHTANEVGLH